jgi:hypothetical protein
MTDEQEATGAQPAGKRRRYHPARDRTEERKRGPEAPKEIQ